MSKFIINNGVLKQYSGIETKITIPDGVKKIDKFVFREFTYLKEVTLPDSVEYIGDYAFAYCDSLTKINLPEKVTHIGVCSFRSCKSLKEITLPDSLTEISVSAFCSCNNLSKVTLGSKTEVIKAKAFHLCKALCSINFPESLKKIEIHAFDSCGFKKLTLPDTLQELDDFAFSSCAELTDLTVNSGVKHIPDFCFFSCTNLKNVTLGEGIESVGKHSFSMLESLTEISLPSTLKHVGKYAFINCNNLYSFYFKNGLPSLIFEDYKSVGREITNKEFFIKLFLFGDKTNNPDFDKICKKAVRRNGTKYFIMICKSEKTDALESFFDCFKKISLSELDLLISLAHNFKFTEQFVMLVNYKNSNYTNAQIEKYEQDELMKELGIKERTLKDWRNLFELKKSDGCYNIIRYRSNKSDVVIPSLINGIPVRKIRQNAFYHSQDIRSVTISEGVELIESFAFNNCHNLSLVNIPKSTVTIGPLCFNKCENVTILVKKGSYAEKFAKSTDTNYNLI